MVVKQTTVSNPKIPGDVTTEQNLKDFWGDQISFQMHFIKNGRKSVEIGFCALFPRARVRESHFFVVQSELFHNFLAHINSFTNRKKLKQPFVIAVVDHGEKRAGSKSTLRL